MPTASSAPPDTPVAIPAADTASASPAVPIVTENISQVEGFACRPEDLFDALTQER